MKRAFVVTSDQRAAALVPSQLYDVYGDRDDVRNQIAYKGNTQLVLVALHGLLGRHGGSANGEC